MCKPGSGVVLSLLFSTQSSMLNAFFNVGGTSVTYTNELIDQLGNSHLYNEVNL